MPERDRLVAEEALEAKGAKWELISALAMPIHMVDEKEEHRHFIAAFDSPFNMLVAKRVSKTQRKQLAKARAASDKEWEKLLKRTTWHPTTIKEWAWFCAIQRLRTYKSMWLRVLGLVFFKDPSFTTETQTYLQRSRRS